VNAKQVVDVLYKNTPETIHLRHTDTESDSDLLCSRAIHHRSGK